jgi:hypothetical protein
MACDVCLLLKDQPSDCHDNYLAAPGGRKNPLRDCGQFESAIMHNKAPIVVNDERGKGGRN